MKPISTNLLNHDCKLYPPEQDVINNFINTGAFIFLRRTLAKYTMLSEKHPYTSVYYKSKESRRHEELRHMVHHPMTIHPFSLMALHWEFWMFFLYSFEICVVAAILVYGFCMAKSEILYLILITANSLKLIDIFKLFFTGYYDKDKNRTILRSWEIAKNYLTSYFIIDLLSMGLSINIPIRLAVGLGNDIYLKFFYSMKLLGYIIILRYRRWDASITLFCSYKNWSKFCCKTIKVVLSFFFLTSWLLTIGIYIEVMADLFSQKGIDFGKQTRDENFSQFFLNELQLFLIAGSIDRKRQSRTEVIISIAYLFTGAAFHVYLYTQVLQIWNMYNTDRTDRIYYQFIEFLKSKGLSVGLREKLFAFFNFTLKELLTEDSLMTKILSENLKREISEHITQQHFAKVDFLNDLPKDVTEKLVSVLKTDIFLPNDLIVGAGDIGDGLYFIYYGTVAVYSKDGKEICHLEDGAHFGEVSLIYSEARITSVVAVTPCELFVLNRSDFTKIIDSCQEVKNKILELANEERNKNVANVKF